MYLLLLCSLSVLAIACALSSLVTQGQAYNWYVSKYGERTAAVIIALHADDAYHSGWFLALTGFLCLNLIGCSLVRLPGLIRRFRRMGDPDAMGEPTATEEGINKPESVFEALRMPAPTAAILHAVVVEGLTFAEAANRFGHAPKAFYRRVWPRVRKDFLHSGGEFFRRG